MSSRESNFSSSYGSSTDGQWNTGGGSLGGGGGVTPARTSGCIGAAPSLGLGRRSSGLSGVVEVMNASFSSMASGTAPPLATSNAAVSTPNAYSLPMPSNYPDFEDMMLPSSSAESGTDVGGLNTPNGIVAAPKKRSTEQRRQQALSDEDEEYAPLDLGDDDELDCPVDVEGEVQISPPGGGYFQPLHDGISMCTESDLAQFGLEVNMSSLAIANTPVKKELFPDETNNNSNSFSQLHFRKPGAGRKRGHLHRDEDDEFNDDEDEEESRPTVTAAYFRERHCRPTFAAPVGQAQGQVRESSGPFGRSSFTKQNKQSSFRPPPPSQPCATPSGKTGKVNPFRFNPNVLTGFKSPAVATGDDQQFDSASKESKGYATADQQDFLHRVKGESPCQKRKRQIM